MSNNEKNPLNNNTQYFSALAKEEISEGRLVIQSVYEALSEKGYDPISQLVGYIMSGDPTYITSHRNARSIIRKIERDELVEELVKNYIKNNFKL